MCHYSLGNICTVKGSTMPCESSLTKLNIRHVNIRLSQIKGMTNDAPDELDCAALPHHNQLRNTVTANVRAGWLCIFSA